MRVSYLAILTATVAMCFVNPHFASLPVLFAVLVGSMSVMVMHMIILGKLETLGNPQNSKKVSLSVIEMLFSEEAGAAIPRANSRSKAGNLLDELMGTPAFNFLSAVIASIGPVPCYPGYWLIQR